MWSEVPSTKKQLLLHFNSELTVSQTVRCSTCLQMGIQQMNVRLLQFNTTDDYYMQPTGYFNSKQAILRNQLDYKILHMNFFLRIFTNYPSILNTDKTVVQCQAYRIQSENTEQDYILYYTKFKRTWMQNVLQGCWRLNTLVQLGTGTCNKIGLAKFQG
jgi:hypothetical protein